MDTASSFIAWTTKPERTIKSARLGAHPILADTLFYGL